MYFFGRGGVRHLGNFGGAMISGKVYGKVARCKEIRRLTASDEDTQEQVWKRFQEVSRGLGGL